jgi:hypothetical protein
VIFRDRFKNFGCVVLLAQNAFRVFWALDRVPTRSAGCGDFGEIDGLEFDAKFRTGKSFISGLAVSHQTLQPPFLRGTMIGRTIPGRSISASKVLSTLEFQFSGHDEQYGRQEERA